MIVNSSGHYLPQTVHDHEIENSARRFHGQKPRNLAVSARNPANGMIAGSFGPYAAVSARDHGMGAQ
jgi:hypothetical protein